MIKESLSVRDLHMHTCRCILVFGLSLSLMDCRYTILKHMLHTYLYSFCFTLNLFYPTACRVEGSPGSKWCRCFGYKKSFVDRSLRFNLFFLSVHRPIRSQRCCFFWRFSCRSCHQWVNVSSFFQLSIYILVIVSICKVWFYNFLILLIFKV